MDRDLGTAEAASVLLSRDGDCFSGECTFDEGRELVLAPPMIAKSALLLELRSEDHDEIRLDVDPLALSAWIEWHQAEEHAGSESTRDDDDWRLSCPDRFLTDAQIENHLTVLQVADYLADTGTVDAVCSVLAAHVVQGTAAADEPATSRDRTHEHPAAAPSASPTLPHHLQTLPAHLGCAILRRVQTHCMANPAISPQFCAAAPPISHPGNRLPLAFLPLSLTVLPRELHALAVRAHAPAADHSSHIHFPHVSKRHAPAATSAASGIPGLTSLSLDISCSGCHIDNGPAAEGGPGTTESTDALRCALEALPATLSALRIAHHTDLESSADFPSEDHDERYTSSDAGLIDPSGTGDLAAVRHGAWRSIAGALPLLTHLRSLELRNVNCSNSDFSAALTALAPTLRVLRLVRCRLALANSTPAPRGTDTAPAAATSWLDVLGMLREVEELDLSGNRVAEDFWAELALRLAAAPLRVLALADCGLEVVKTVSRLVAAQGTNASGAELPEQYAAAAFAALRQLDVSENCFDAVPGAGSLAPMLCRLVSLKCDRVTCSSVSALSGFLRELRQRRAEMQTFEFGVIADAPGATDGLRGCLHAWPQLRTLRLAWPTPVRLQTMLGDAAARMPALVDLHVEHACVGDAAASWLPQQAPYALTRLVLSHAQCSRRGAEALAHWLAAMTTLRTLCVLDIAGERSGRRRAGAAGRCEVMGCLIGVLARLPALRELCMHCDWVYSGGSGEDGAAAALLEPLVDTLPALHRMTRLEVRAPEDGELQHGAPAAHAFARALAALTKLEELHVAHVRLGGAGGHWLDALCGMRALRMLRLERCLPFVCCLRHPLVGALAGGVLECLPERATLWDEPQGELGWEEAGGGSGTDWGSGSGSDRG